MIPVQICIAYGSMALFIALLNNVFLLYYVELFVTIYRIDKASFWLGEAVFLIWNSVNDPLFGWLSDHKSLSSNNCGASSPQVVQKRFRALAKYGPMFALSFVMFWFQWSSPGLQFVVCLCLYDGFLSMVDLNHLALLADLALSASDRTRLNAYCSAFSACGCMSVFLSYYVWNKDNIASFRLFCLTLSMFSMVGFTTSSIFLRRHLKCDKVKVDTPIEEVGKSMEVAVTQSSEVSHQQVLEVKGYIKQLINHKNFLWFAVMNLVQVFHCHFNSNFFPLFLEKLLGDTISPKMGAVLLGVSFVVPHINNLYFLTLCRKYGVYVVIKWLFYAKLLLGLSIMSCGPQWPVLLCIFIASNRVFTEGTCKLLNLVISDLVDEDFVMNGRKQAISALVFGTSALLSKPGQTLAPLLGTWLLAKQTGTSVFYSASDSTNSSFHETSGKDLRWGCFCVLVYVPIACAVIQILAWSRFNLHGNRLTWVKHMRKNQGFMSANIY